MGPVVLSVVFFKVIRVAIDNFLGRPLLAEYSKKNKRKKERERE